MNELITLKTSEGGKKTVSAKELYLGLGLSKKNWSRWYPINIEENEFFNEGYDFTGVRLIEEGNETVDFEITLEFAKHIAMMSKTEKAHKYRNYFLVCEKQLESFKTQTFLNKIEDFQNSLEEAKRQFKPSHSKKLQYNKLIKQLSYTDDEFAAIQTFVFAMLGVDKWENTAVEDGPRIMELINTSAALISSKQFQQTKLY